MRINAINHFSQIKQVNNKQLVKNNKMSRIRHDIPETPTQTEPNNVAFKGALGGATKGGGLGALIGTAVAAGTGGAIVPFALLGMGALAVIGGVIGHSIDND